LTFLPSAPRNTCHNFKDWLRAIFQITGLLAAPSFHLTSCTDIFTLPTANNTTIHTVLIENTPF
jgi:hypothetical protein